jgi:hypothetical protein
MWSITNLYSNILYYITTQLPDIAELNFLYSSIFRKYIFIKHLYIPKILQIPFIGRFNILLQSLGMDDLLENKGKYAYKCMFRKCERVPWFACSPNNKTLNF